MSESNWSTPAPGELELVRRFLNTWRIPGETRMPEDRLPALVRDRRAWREWFPNTPLGSHDTEDGLLRLRDDLREVVARTEGWPKRLNGWLAQFPMVAVVERGEDEQMSIRYDSSPEAGFEGLILSIVARSIDEGTWFRLKACPDCRHVFYDRSRSRTRVWCGMLAGDGGRACGTIAKVKRYRQKRQGTAPA